VTTLTSRVDRAKPDAGADRASSTATAKDLKYEDASRRLTYSGDAHLSGAMGDLTAARIELYLKPSGDDFERVDAFDAITLREQTGRKTTGDRMTYLSAGEQYVVAGAPVAVVDPCGRETKGRTLTLFKATDRIVVDGNEQTRTQTRSGSTCP
jgi:lipopolysaccharide export system protein LptA